jgi:hypothetical protein
VYKYKQSCLLHNAVDQRVRAAGADAFEILQPFPVVLDPFQKLVLLFTGN